jgi:hypothetical protein
MTLGMVRFGWSDPCTPATRKKSLTRSCYSNVQSLQSANAFMHYKDLRINPAHKHQTIRDWGNEPTTSVTSALGKHPVGMHSSDYKKIFHEGLGIDHKEWMKAKQQQNSQK